MNPATSQDQRLLEGKHDGITAVSPTTMSGAAGAVEPVHHHDHIPADASDWAHLATDLLQMLAIQLEAKEMRASRLVCRHWRLHISARCKAFDNPIQLDLCPGPQDWLMKVEALRGIFPSLQQCALLISSRRSRSEVEAHMRVLISWTQLTSLQVRHLVPNKPRLGTVQPQLAEMLRHLTHLRALDLFGGEVPRPCDILALTTLVNLEELRMSFNDTNPNKELITGRHVRAFAELTSLKRLEFEASHFTVNDSDLVTLTSLSRLQSLSMAPGILFVKGQKLQELSKLTGLSRLNLMPHLSCHRESELLAVVTSLAACPALKDIELTIPGAIWPAPPLPPIPSLMQAVASHLTSGLTSLHINQWMDTSHLALLAQLTALQSLGVRFTQSHQGDLSSFSVLSTLRRLQSFSLSLRKCTRKLNMDKVAVDRLCSAWGGQLSHLSLLNLGASESYGLACGMRSLRSLCINAPLPRMLAWLRPSFSQLPSSQLPSSQLPSTQLPSSQLPSSQLPSSQLPSCHLPTALTSLDLSDTKLCCLCSDMNPHDVVLAIQMFLHAFLPQQQMDDRMVAAQASESCQAVAGALYECAKAATNAGGTFPAHILAKLEEAAQGSRGVRAAAPHLLQCTQLRHLSLQKCEIEPSELVALLLSCPELESLRLTDVEFVGEAHVAVMGQLKQLVSITLRQVQRLDDMKASRDHLPMGCLRYLASLPELRNLDLDIAALRTANLGWAAQDALKGMRRLYKLTCTGCKDNNAITDVLRCLPHADM